MLFAVSGEGVELTADDRGKKGEVKIGGSPPLRCISNAFIVGLFKSKLIYHRHSERYFLSWKNKAGGIKYSNSKHKNCFKLKNVTTHVPKTKHCAYSTMTLHLCLILKQ